MAENSKMTETLKGLQAELEEQIAGNKEKLRPLLESRDALVAKIQPLEKELQELDKQIYDTEQDLKIRDVGNQYAEVCRVLGAKSLRNGV